MTQQNHPKSFIFQLIVEFIKDINKCRKMMIHMKKNKVTTRIVNISILNEFRIINFLLHLIRNLNLMILSIKSLNKLTLFDVKCYL